MQARGRGVRRDRGAEGHVESEELENRGALNTLALKYNSLSPTPRFKFFACIRERPSPRDAQLADTD